MKFCMDCGKRVSTNKTKRCKSCAQKGELNYNYKKIHTFNQKEYLKKWKLEHPKANKEWYMAHRKPCIDCGKLIDKRSQRCLSCARKAERNHLWKGGITELCHWIRGTLNNREWIKNAMIRDNYTCQECGARGNIEVHHIVSFSVLLSDFLQTYNQFSPIDDKETLVRLATTYKPFWEVNNGITLCPTCHKIGEHKWGLRLNK